MNRQEYVKTLHLFDKYTTDELKMLEPTIEVLKEIKLRKRRLQTLQLSRFKRSSKKLFETFEATLPSSDDLAHLKYALNRATSVIEFNNKDK